MADVGRFALTAVGYFFGGPLGGMIGSAVGAALFPAPPIKVEGPRLQDLKTQISATGYPIPLVFGTMRVAGNVIACSNKIETKHVESQGGKGGGPSTESTTYTYSINCAISVCEGPATVSRIWCNKKLVYSASSSDLATLSASLNGYAKQIRIYKGTEDQRADSLIQTLTNSKISYRGLCYVVFERLELEEFGNNLPQFEFEVTSNASIINKSFSTAEMPFDYKTSDDYFMYNRIRIVSVDASGIKYIKVNKYQQSNPYLYRYDLMYYDFASKRHNKLNNVSHITNGSSYTYNPIVYSTVDEPIFAYSEIYDSNNNSLNKYDYKTKVIKINNNTFDASYPSYSHKVYVTQDFYEYYEFDYKAVSARYIAQVCYYPLYNANNNNMTNTSKIYKVRIINLKTKQELFFDYSSYIDNNNFEIKSVNIQEDYVFLIFSTGVNKIKMLIIDAINNSIVESKYITYTSDKLSHFVFDNNTLYFCDGNTSQLIKYNYYNDTYDYLYFNADLVDKEQSQITNFWNIVIQDTLYLSNGFYVLGKRGYWYNSTTQTGYQFSIARDILNKNKVSTKTIVEKLLSKSGLNVSNYDVSLTKETSGYAIGQSMSVRDAIEPIQKIDAFDAVDSNNKLIFKSKNTSIVKAIDKELLSVKQGILPSDEYYVYTAESSDNLPAEINLKFSDVNKDYELNTEIARRELYTSIADQKSVIEMEVPFAMYKSEAQKIAKQTIFDAFAYKDNYDFSTSRVNEDIEVGDIIEIETDVSVVKVKITEKENVGYNIINFKAKREASTYAIEETNVDENYESGTIQVTGYTNFRFLDLPPLYDNSDYTSGFYIAAEGFGNQKWSGCSVYQSNDNGLSYDRVFNTNKKSQIGYAITALPYFNDTIYTIDYINTVDIYSDVELESITLDSFLSNKYLNVIYIGKELVRYQKAELISENVYRLSNLIRYVKMTGIDYTHVVNEDVVTIDTNIGFYQNKSTDNNVSKMYNIVSFSKTINDGTFNTFTNTNYILKPIKPLLDAYRAADGIYINITKGIRKNEYLINSTSNLLDDSTNLIYTINIYSGTTLKRTLTSTIANSTSDVISVPYLNANITTDFGSTTTTSEITFECYLTNNSGYSSDKTTIKYKIPVNPAYNNEQAYLNYINTLTPSINVLRNTKINGNGTLTQVNTVLDDIYLKNTDALTAGQFYNGTDSVTNNHTIVCNFKPDDFYADFRVFQLVTSAATNNGIRLRKVSNAYTIEIGLASPPPGQTSNASINITSYINNNAMNTIIISTNGAGTTNFYVNGTKLTASTSNYTIAGNMTALGIGTSCTTTGVFTQTAPTDQRGISMHSFATFNRFLTDAEALNIRNNLVQ